MTPSGSGKGAESKMQGFTRKEWRQPELRKLPIAATANSHGKPNAVNNSDGTGMPKVADSHGQMS
jgi:hypothetical protein